MKKTGSLLLLAAVVMMVLCGCRVIRIEEEERKPLTYSVMKQEDIPGELAALIGEKKAKEFQMTYQSGEDLYLVKGYGRQMCGGYSIQVKELGVTSKAVFFRTKLLGPQNPEEGAHAPSYPYIVVKTAWRKEPVEFV